ncbi:MAG TPA: two-component sensor histidine kinase, partial [Paraburkholderia sp.]|nr:two-component sensor histidine kinase [Paraburkholderia sp.]
MKAAGRWGSIEPPSAQAADGAARYATIVELHRLDIHAVTRRLLILVVLVAGLVAVCGLTWTVTLRRGIDNQRLNAAVRADRTTSALKSTLERYESLPYLLAAHPFVQEALDAPTPEGVGRANRYLEHLNQRAR